MITKSYKMKQLIPLLILVNILSLHNCRQSDQISEEENKSVNSSFFNKDPDSTKVKEVDPDPPVKDGQDWKNSQP